MGNASTMEIVAGAVRAGTDQQDITQNAHIHHNLNTKKPAPSADSSCLFLTNGYRIPDIRNPITPASCVQSNFFVPGLLVGGLILTVTHVEPYNRLRIIWDFAATIGCFGTNDVQPQAGKKVVKI